MFKAICSGVGLFSLVIGTVQAADLQMASIFSPGMVVQRNQKIPVWGKGDPEGKVEVELNGQHGEATVGADGWWRVDLEPMAAGGPYVLSATMAEKHATVDDVLCGDVWLCSGQSNMQMSAGECVGGEQAADEAVKYPQLRFLQIGKGGADEPQRPIQKPGEPKWQHATPQTARKFAAVGYFFAQRLLEDPALKGVPIGLIDSSFGGTSAEAWTPKEDLSWLPKDERSGSMFGIPSSALYNAMIYPLAPAGLTGVLWYQGEANAGKPEAYAKVLTSMIQGWRQRWNRPELPFFVVELPPYADKFNGHYFTWVREAQSKVAKDVPHVDVVTTTNTTDGSDLHPKTKQEIGRRASLLARRDVYGEKIVAQGPVFKEMKSDGGQLHVAFDTAGNGLASRDPEQLRGFQVAGADGSYYFANADIQGDEVVLKSKEVAEPKTVRYAWMAVPTADLTNRDGLPAALFRTDDLPPMDNNFTPSPGMSRLVTKSIDVSVDSKGSVRSLGVGGQQFLSNSFGNSGGTSFPGGGGFGGRELTKLQEVQPDRFRFEDGSTSLEITADDQSTTWTLKNDGKEDLRFRITLANGVTATSQDGALLLERFHTRARVEGAGELQQPGPDGQVLLTPLPARSTIVLKISHEK